MTPSGVPLGAFRKALVTLADPRDIRTRVAHSESNKRLERLHRIEEGSNGEELTGLTRCKGYCNHRRPHSPLGYLQPVDYNHQSSKDHRHLGAGSTPG
jgi:transposase InsO family protein